MIQERTIHTIHFNENTEYKHGFCLFTKRLHKVPLRADIQSVRQSVDRELLRNYFDI